MKSLILALAASASLATANPQWGPFSNPFAERGVCAADNCAREVTGTNAGQPLATRSADCSSFLSPVPTPTVPAYASACSGSARYSSACGCLGIAAPTATCLSSAQATNIVNTFASFLTAPQGPNFASQANSLLADDFVDTSGSINWLAGYPIDGPTFPSKQAFIGGQGAQPPIPSITTLDIFYTCDKIAWRWVANGIGSGVLDVKGINVFTINASGQISEVYDEFNSGAWAQDLAAPSGSSSSTTSAVSTTKAATTATTTTTSKAVTTTAANKRGHV